MVSKVAVVAIAVATIAIIAGVAFVVLNEDNDSYRNMKLTDKTFETEDGHLYNVYTGNVATVSALGKIPYYYSDGYFMQDPKIYNESLATLSFYLAINGFVDEDAGEKQSDDIREFLQELGCTDFYVNQAFKETPTEDSIGVAIATIHRTIGGEDLTILAVALRSGGYGVEWVSNFYVGQGIGESQGFSQAAEQVCGELYTYMSDHKIDGKSKNVRFWMTGYSRGAAAINIAAKNVVDTYDQTGSRTFAYTFATPAGGVQSAIVEGSDYTCIHNIYDRRDLVPPVAPADFGFFHYGVDHFVPGTDAGQIYEYVMEVSGALDTDRVTQLIDNFDGFEVDITKCKGYQRMSEYLRIIFGMTDDDEFHTALLTLDGDVISEKKAQQSLFLRELFKDMATWAGMNRQVYADGDASLQGCLQQIVRCDESIFAIIYSFVPIFSKAAPVMNENRNNPQVAIDYILNECEKPRIITLSGFSDAQYEFLINYLVKFAYKDLEQNDWKGSKIAGTIISNGSTVIAYHFPMYMPCWLMALDPMYDDYEPDFSSEE